MFPFPFSFTNSYCTVTLDLLEIRRSMTFAHYRLPVYLESQHIYKSLQYKVDYIVCVMGKQTKY